MRGCGAPAGNHCSPNPWRENTTFGLEAHPGNQAEDARSGCQPRGRRTVGERLVCVRYLYDAAGGRRLKTVELVVETVPWRPRARAPRRRDEDIVAVRIRYHETELRERAKRLGAIWRPAQKVWELSWADARRLGIADRVGSGQTPDAST